MMDTMHQLLGAWEPFVLGILGLTAFIIILWQVGRG